MKGKFIFALCLLISVTSFVQAQISTKKVEDFKVSTTHAVYLGKSKKITELVQLESTSKEKKDAVRKLKKVPDNFKWRTGKSKASNFEKEHQGVDPLWQKGFSGERSTVIEPFVNMDGIGAGSPLDPTGDVSTEYYVQAVNVTEVAVYDLEGNMVQTFAMNTLWSQFNSSSAGDPIILYDEEVNKWIITEFTDPANLLIAVSDSGDPLGSYNAYSFSTPQFPDYPKYAITPKALVVTTNEEGAGTLHNYFIDRIALLNGDASVTIQRVAVTGNNSTEAGFYVTTPVDWNGSNAPYDDRPIVVAINDSSWPGGPAEDQIELYSFDVDFATPANTQIIQTSIVTTPFDSYPCAATGFGFACIPQMGGTGLDGIPEVIMNIPHLRNFGTHESMVFNFITDVTDGDDLSGIRWMELRRVSGGNWSIYQEGTYAPDDGLHRFMGSIAIDDDGNIGMGYNVSGPDTYAGVRFTGRFSSDPLGEMTVDEVIAVEGLAPISSGGRFGDYSQMSVSPDKKSTFWFTTEYAGNSFAVTESRIVAFQLAKDSFDLSVRSILEPMNSSALTASELVTAEIFNPGVNAISNFTVGLIFEGSVVETATIPGPLNPEEALNYQFTMPLDLSNIQDYSIGAYVAAAEDLNPNNDTLFNIVTKLAALEAGVSASLASTGCDSTLMATISINNLGGDVIQNAEIEVKVNNVIVGLANYSGSISFGQTGNVSYTIEDNLNNGSNTIEFNMVSVNGSTSDFNPANNSFSLMQNLDFNLVPITIIFVSDEYPEETTWTLTMAGSSDIIASGGLDEALAASLTHLCVPSQSCYVLTVVDAAGDGICCDYGEGNFSVLGPDNNLLFLNDGVFGNFTTEEFCLGGDDCILTAEINVEDASAANQADGSIMIIASNGVEPYVYSIDGGTTFQASPLFEDLVPNDYDVVVMDADGNCSFDEAVTVDIISSTQVVNGELVNITIRPNPTDGLFTIDIENLKIQDPQLQLEIFDISGKLLQQRVIGKYDNSYTGTFSLMAFPAGHYYVRCTNKDVNFLEKIIKQ